MSRKAVISTAVSPIHREPLFSSEMVTQALMWEQVEILNEDNLWFHIRQEDGYEGWIYTFYMIENAESYENWLTLNNRFIPFASNEDDAGEHRSLSFGTQVPVLEENNQSVTIVLPGEIVGTIPPQIRDLEKSRRQLITLAKSLLGTPYIWGGKSAFGFDCSGFVQLVFKTMGINIARDTGMQVKSAWVHEISVNEANPGDLVFFAEDEKINHVGISLGECKIIHCSGEVKIESIIEGDAGFNPWLSQSFFKTFSISEKVFD